MMCQRTGRLPISTIGLGRTSVSSESRVPRPPARIRTFIDPAIHEEPGGRPLPRHCDSCPARPRTPPARSFRDHPMTATLLEGPGTAGPDAPARVVVTGATGFVGRNALDPLHARGYDVHAVHRAA